MKTTASESSWNADSDELFSQTAKIGIDPKEVRLQTICPQAYSAEPEGTQTLRTCFASKNSYKLLKTSPCGVCELHGKVMYMADSKALRGKSLWFRSRKGIKNNLDFVKFQFILKLDKRFKQITISRLCCTSLYNVEVSGSL